MEKEPNSENKIEKSRVLAMLSEKGLEDSETMELIIAWTEQQEGLVSQENTPLAALKLDFERVDLYLALGHKENALEHLDGCLIQVEQLINGREKLDAERLREIEEIKEKILSMVGRLNS